MATPDEGPWGGKASHSPAGSRRPNWRQFERDGAYLLPSGLASDDAQLAAHARMHQLALAYEDSDPLVTRFKGINPKVVQWDAAYLQSLQAMRAVPLRKSLSPVRQPPPPPGLPRQGNREPTAAGADGLGGQPSSLMLGLSQVDTRFEERPLLPPVSPSGTPRALFVSKAPPKADLPRSPRLAPLEVEAALALAMRPAGALALADTLQARSSAAHWTDMVRSTPDPTAITSFGRQSVEAMGERVWAPQQRSFLPLAQFDDSTLADKSAAASSGRRGRGSPAKSKWVHSDGRVEWTECQVVAASEDGQQYLVEWRLSGKQKWVSVLNILFEGETQEDLEARRAAAEGYRATQETAMLRNMLVQRMPRDGGAEMPAWLSDNIRRRIGRLAEGPKLSKFSTPDHPLRLGIGWMQSGQHWMRQLEPPDEEKLGYLFQEVTDDFLATNNEVIFDNSVVAAANTMPVEAGAGVLQDLEAVKGGKSSYSAGTRGLEECLQAPPVRCTAVKLAGVTVVGNCHRLKALQAIHMYMQDITELDLFGIKSISYHERSSPNVSRRSTAAGRAASPIRGSAPASRDNEMARFLDDSETAMMSTLKEISSRVLSNMCNIFMDAAEEEADALVAAGRSAGDMDVDAYGRLVVLANMKVHNVLNRHLSHSIQVYTDAVGFMAAKEIATSLFFTNLEVDGSKIVYNPPLASFTQRLIATIASAVDTMNKTPAIALSPALVWDKSKGTASFTIDLAGSLPHVLRMDSPLVVSATTKIQNAMKRSLVQLADLLDNFGDHDRLLGAGKGAGDLFLKQWQQHNGDRLEDWEDAIAAYRKEEAEIVAELPTQIAIGIYHVNCAAVRNQLVEGAQWFAEILLSELAREALRLASGCKGVLTAIHDDICAPSHNLEELYALLDRLAAYPEAVDEQRLILEKVGARLELLDKYHFQLDPEDFVDIWATMALPNTIDEATAARRNSIMEEENEYVEHLQQMQVDFQNKLYGLKDEVDRWQTEDDEDEASFYVVEVRRLGERLAALRDEAALINSREALINWEPTDYKQIEDLNKQLAPYVDLWTLVSDYQKWMAKWMYGPLFSVNLDALEQQVPLWMKTLMRLEKALTAGPYRVASNTKAAIEDCAYHLPLTAALRTPGLRERHWLRVYEITGVSPDEDRHLWSMQMVIQLGFMNHLLEISEVVELAVKEMAIEKVLDKVDAEFSGMEIDLRPHGRTGTQVMWGGDDLVMMLDDTMLRLQGLLMSPYVEPHKDRAVYWEGAIASIQALTALWIQVQRSWAHAEILFNSETTAKQMPTEARRFAVIDITWRNIVAETSQFPNLIDISQRGSLIERLKDAQQRLSQIIKGMQEYLNLKRMQFPRFNFLSNNTLLELLERSPEPAQVEPFLHKVFPGAEYMLLAPPDEALPDACTLLGIASGEGERLLFSTPIQLKASATNIAYEVDHWMTSLEKSMQQAIMADIENLIRTYGSGNYGDWLFSGCSQAVTLVSSMVWSHEVSTILNFIQEHRKGDESERQQVTEAGTRGSFIPDVEVHGRGSQHVSRHLRHAHVVDVNSASKLDGIQEEEEEHEDMSSGKGSLHAAHVRQMKRALSSVRIVSAPKDGQSAGDDAVQRGILKKLPKSMMSVKTLDIAERKGMLKRFALPVPQRFIEKNNESLVAASQADELFSVVNSFMASELEDIMRILAEDLEAKRRSTLTNLVVTKIYQRDMVARLIAEKVDHEGDFEWVRQLRYQIQHEDKSRRESKAVLVCCMETRAKYGLEYLGMHQRLVLTPLTERAFATLLSAVHLKKGGAPEGPAGTGKTETVKELARYTGKQFVLYNCTESLDMTAIVKILAGAVSTGAWACFDEFNRLAQGVLSVLAKHILTIQTELIAGSSRVALGPHTLVELNPGMALFTTCNPTYMARQRDMPSNIKELFRPVAMMRPDYVIIAEVLLFAAGFQQARTAAQQIVGCLQVASQRLSRSAHYDFGMRTLKLLIQKCKTLKAAADSNAYMLESRAASLEMLYCQRALQRVIIPRLLPQDVPVFEVLLQNAFPEDGGSRGDNLKLVETLRKVGVDTPSVQVGTHIVRHAIQLADMVEMQPGVMLLGNAGCGKTALRRLLLDAIRRLKAAPGFKLTETVIYPKAISKEGLYGSYSSSSQLWADGIFTAALREASASTSGDHWIVLDGPVDPVWMEDLNTLLDDSRELTLGTGETIKLRTGTNLLFETDSITHASPASIGRLGIVHMLHDADDWRYVISCWVNSALPAELMPHANKLDVMMKAFCRPLLTFLAMPGRSMLPQAGVALVSSMLRLLGGQLLERRPSSWATLSIRDTNVLLESFVMFAIVWSLGANCSYTDRSDFNEEMHRLQRLELSYQQSSAGIIVRAHMRGVLVPFPDEGTVFDYAFDSDTQKWDSWAGRAYATRLPPGSPASGDVRALMVPTAESVARSRLLQLLFLPGDCGPVMLAGPTGSGKSMLVESFLRGVHRWLGNKDTAGANADGTTADASPRLSASFAVFGTAARERQASEAVPDDRTAVFHVTVQLSKRSGVEEIQASVGRRLQKVAQGELGPPGGKPGVIFIEDMGLAPVDGWGACGPLEALRSWLEQRAWREPGANKLVALRRLQVFASLTTGQLGSPHHRLMRQCAVVTTPAMNSAALARIFKAICDVSLVGCSSDVRTEAHALVEASCTVLREMSSRLLPVPSRPHYLFSVRDLARVFQGIMTASKDAIVSPESFAVLWYHETMRSMFDKLLDPSLRHWFLSLLTKVMQGYSCITRKTVGDPDGMEVLFANFYRQRGDVYCTTLYGAEKLSRSEALDDMLAHESDGSKSGNGSKQDDPAPKLSGGESKKGMRVKLPEEASTPEEAASELGPSNAGAAADDVEDWQDSGDAELEAMSAASMAQAERSTKLAGDERKQTEELRMAAEAEEHGSETAQGLANLRQAQRQIGKEMLANGRKHESKTATLRGLLELYQEEFNLLNTRHPLKLVMFRASVAQLARVSRIVSQPGGHLLLLGQAGSGRNGIARLGIFLSGMQCVEINVRPGYSRALWREDLKKMLHTPGVMGRGVVLLLRDRARYTTDMMDDLVQLMSSGHVRGLYAPDELETIVARLHSKYAAAHPASPQEAQPSNWDLLQFFFEQCRQHLRVVLATDPTSALFSSRLREFPQLISLCHVTCVDQWSSSSRTAVAEVALSRVSLLGPDGLYADHRETIIRACVQIHRTMLALSKDYSSKDPLFRVANAEFLELLKQVPPMLKHMQSNSGDQHDKYIEGVNNMKDLAYKIKQLEEALISIQPAILASSDETERLLQRVHAEQDEASMMQQQLEIEEKAAEKSAVEAYSLRDQCDADLEASMPPLRRALKELQNINKGDIAELKSLKNPPVSVKVVMKAVCHMLGAIPQGIQDRRNLEPEVEDALWWRESMKLLGQINFMEILLTFDKNSIPESVIKQVDYFTSQPEFNAKSIAKVSKAATCLCRWVLAIDMYHDTKNVIGPKTDALHRAERQLLEKQARLEKKRETLGAIHASVEDLKFKYESAMAHRDQLQVDMRNATEKVERARHVLKALTTEKAQWEAAALELNHNVDDALGNTLLASAFVAYCGSLPPALRSHALSEWKNILTRLNIKHNTSFDFASMAGEEMMVAEWIDAGLSQSANAIETAIIMERSSRWPLIIDPQEQALSWLQQLYSNKLIEQVSATDQDGINTLIRSMEKGVPVIITSDGKGVSPTVDQLMERRTFAGARGELSIQLGEAVHTFDRRFKPFLWSRLQRPEFSPALLSKMSIINFTITPDQLIERVFLMVLRFDNPDMDRERAELRRTKSRYQSALREIEQGILEGIASKDAVAILESPVVYTMLSQARDASADLKFKLERVNYMQQRILDMREVYVKGIAQVASELYFMLSDMRTINHAYRFSLKWFSEIFNKALAQCPRGTGAAERMVNLRRGFIELLYNRTCQSLYEKDKLPLALNMTLRLMKLRKQITGAEVAMLIHGTLKGVSMENNEGEGVKPRIGDRTRSTRTTRMLQVMAEQRTESELAQFSDDDSSGSDWESDGEGSVLSFEGNLTPKAVEPASRLSKATKYQKPGFLSDGQWAKLTEMVTIPAFCIILKELDAHGDLWKDFLEADRDFVSDPPQQWVENLSLLHIAILTRVLQPQRLVMAVQRLVTDHLGANCAVAPSFNVEAAYEASVSTAPIIYILTPGVHPVPMLMKFADQRRRRVLHVIMGHDQGEVAEKTIRGYMQQGRWVLLENVHLAGEWMQRLDSIVSQLDSMRPHPEFRLWMTMQVSQDVPASLLQASLKLIDTKAASFTENLHRTIKRLPRDLLNDPELGDKRRTHAPTLHQPEDALWRRLVMAICYFHAVVLERRHYGELSWNFSYSFSDADFDTSINYLIQMYQSEVDFMQRKEQGVALARNLSDPLAAVSFFVGQCVYGGRVTDNWDRRVLQVMLDQLLQQASTQFGQITYVPGAPPVPFDALLHHFAHGVEHDLQLPSAAAAVGLHSVASLAQDVQDHQLLVSSMKAMDTHQISTEGPSQEDVGRGKAEALLTRIPPDVSVKAGNSGKMRWAQLRRLFRSSSHGVAKAMRSSSSKGTDPAESPVMDQVLQTEKQMYQELIGRVRQDLTTMIAAIDGMEPMTAQMQSLIRHLYHDMVPVAWRKMAERMDSTSLASWASDLDRRLIFMRQWIRNGAPITMPLGMLLAPNMFLASLLQSHAHEYGIPIGKLSFDCQVLARDKPVNSADGPIPMRTLLAEGTGELWRQTSMKRRETARRSGRFGAEGMTFSLDDKDILVTKDGLIVPQAPPPAGWYVAGLVLQGAAWNNADHCLKEINSSQPEQLMPIMWLIPTARVEHERCLVQEVDFNFNVGRYLCPLYYGNSRSDDGQEDSTRSHSDMSIAILPLHGGQSSPEHWVQRGVALRATTEGIQVLPKSQQPRNAVDDLITISLEKCLVESRQKSHTLQRFKTAKYG